MAMKQIVFFFALVFPALLFGQIELLDTVQVQANKINSRLSQTGRQIQIVDQDVLRATSQGSVSDALEQHTNVDIRQRGPFDIQTDLGIRGGSFDQSLVLIDGMPMTDPQTGHHQMNLPIEVLDLERIEVLYGGASRTFGPGAFSGAVNFITRVPTKSQGYLYLTLGENNLWGWHLSQSVVKKKNWLRVSLFKRHSNGYLPNTDFDLLGGTIKAGTTWKKIDARLNLGYSDKRFGALNFYTAAFPNQQEATKMLNASFDLRKTGSWSWNVKGYYRRHRDQFELFREGKGYYRYENGFFIKGEADTARTSPTAYYTYHNQHRTDVAGVDANVSKKWKAGTSLIGVQNRWEHLLSNNLGKPLNEPISITGVRERYTRWDYRHITTLFLEHDWQWKGLRLNFGSAVQTSTINSWELLPGADLSYRWKGKHQIYISTGRSMRLPTYTDLYYNRGGAVGSINLQPEFANNYEAGYRFSYGRTEIRSAIFRREGKNLIDWITLPTDSLARASNLKQLDLNGIEVGISYAGEKWIKRVGINYSYQQADQQAFPYVSIYVLDYLTHNLVAFWDVQLTENLQLQLRGQLQERNGTYKDVFDSSIKEYVTQGRLDAQLYYEITNWALYINAYNLLDMNQFDRAGIQLPGRWLSAGVRMSW